MTSISQTSRRLTGWHEFLLVLIMTLVGIGTVFVYSASMRSRPSDLDSIFLGKHLLFLSIGIAVGVIASSLSGKAWQRLAPWVFIASIVLLVAVLIPGVGKRVNGAQRWMQMPGFSFQPSEIAKFSIPLFLCWWLQVNKNDLRRWRTGFLPVVLSIGPVILLVAVEPDLGTSIFLTLTAGCALAEYGWPFRYFAAGIAIVVPFAITGMIFKPYQMQRITGLIDAHQDLSQAPYQVKQSLVTIGSGGWFGSGLGRGIQKLSFLPESNNDFVFAVIGEELGLIGTLGVLVTWIVVYATALKILHRVRQQRFQYALGFTLISMIFLQAMLNMAVVVAVIPPKGIAHPLLSYGGSNLVMTFISLGTFIGLTRVGSEPAVSKMFEDDGPIVPNNREIPFRYRSSA